MYYVIYPLLYLLSLLPWRVLYLLSDGLAALTYHVIGYRKEVVLSNLRIAFPEKTEAERVKIAKEFYRNLIDTFIETIKLLSVGDKEFARRYTTNNEIINQLYDTGKNVQIHSGHFFNLEVVNLGESRFGVYPFVVVYMPISNKVFDKIILNLRTRYGAILIPAIHFKSRFHQYVQGRYALALAADQNPGNPMAAQWVKFFGRYTPFVTGPEKGAKRNDTAIFFANFHKTKRGHYQIEYELITTDPRSFPPGRLTQLFAAKVEAAVRLRPANYLWSHRRWKWEYDEAKHGNLVIE